MPMQLLVLTLLGGGAAAAASLATPVGPQCTQTSFPVPNGDFESGSLAPWELGTYNTQGAQNISIVAGSSGSSGQYVAQLSSAGTRGYTLKQLSIPTCQAYNFTVSFDYRFTNVSSDCSLGVSASHIYRSLSVSLPANQTQWTTHSFTYTDFIYQELELSARLDCPSGSQAVAQLDNFQLAQGASLEPAACPKNVELENGGFESGELAPWTLSPAWIENIADYGVVSAGYGPGSKYLYRVDVPTTNYSLFQLVHPVHNLCLDYNYTVTFDVNWGNYTQAAPRPTGCQLSNSLAGESFRNFTLNPLYIDPVSPVGWQSFNFTVQAGHTGDSVLELTLACNAQLGQKGPYPPIGAFSLQLDNVALKLTEQ